MINKLKTYLPLLIVITVALSMSAAIHNGGNPVNPLRYMDSFMGFFFCLLSMFKLFDINGFADGFQKYDIISKNFRTYALMYPFIELGLGISFLAHTFPFITNAITLVVMSISSLGVIGSLMKGLDVRCACLGTILKVPLSSISIVENIGMGLMAAINLIVLLKVI